MTGMYNYEYRRTVETWIIAYVLCCMYFCDCQVLITVKLRRQELK
jgi:hypothetical protein